MGKSENFYLNSKRNALLFSNASSIYAGLNDQSVVAIIISNEMFKKN